MKLESETPKLSWNAGNQITSHRMPHPKRTDITSTPVEKAKNSHFTQENEKRQTTIISLRHNPVLQKKR